MLLNLLRAQFGELPASVVEKIRSIEDEAELQTLSERLLKANSLEKRGSKED